MFFFSFYSSNIYIYTIKKWELEVSSFPKGLNYNSDQNYVDKLYIYIILHIGLFGLIVLDEATVHRPIIYSI